MLPKPRADLKSNTADYESLPLVKATGFREYDARWLFAGDQSDGHPGPGPGPGHLAQPRPGHAIVVGHDYRSYSRRSNRR